MINHNYAAEGDLHVMHLAAYAPDALRLGQHME